MSQPVLHGFGPSVYTWAARLGLGWKGVGFGYREINPFDLQEAEHLRALHPFGRVPVLEHEGRRVWETRAILAYVDTMFEGPRLTPSDPVARTRMVQVQSIVDQYAYWPMVRQVYVHGVARAAAGDTAERAAGLAASGGVLDALDEIAAEGLVLSGQDLSLADALLFPMTDYFQRDAEAAEMLAARGALAAWYGALCEDATVRETRPAIEGEER